MRRGAADRLRRLQTATAALTGAMTVQEVSGVILEQAIGVVRADAGLLVLPSEDGHFLNIVAMRGEPETLDGVGRQLHRLAVDDDAAIGEAYRSGAPVWVPSRREWERRFAQGIVTTDSTARSILAVPMRVDDQRLGVVGLLFEAEGRLSKGERRLATTFAEQAALALERARLFEAERQARDTTERLQALAASLAVVATANEVLTILVEDGSAVVGAASAWAAVLDRGAQELHAVAWRGYDPQPDRSLPDAVPRSSPPGDGRGPGATRDLVRLAGGLRRRVSGVRAAESKSMVAGSGACRCSIRLDARSVSCRCNCLRAGRSPGVSGPRSERSSRSAPRRSNARSSMSWSTRWRPPSRRACSRVRFQLTHRVSVATRYRPGTEELDVGGDWYDVIQIGSDRIGVAIGDVVGHGLEAASAMGQLRSALRGLALTGHGPGMVIEGLDRFARTSAPATMATVAYAELDLATNALRYACAGHPPPVIQTAGQVRFLERGRTTPLAALPGPDPMRGGDGGFSARFRAGPVFGRTDRAPRRTAGSWGWSGSEAFSRTLPPGHPESLAELLLAELIDEIPRMTTWPCSVCVPHRTLNP